jgi:hypothetical protein
MDGAMVVIISVHSEIHDCVRTFFAGCAKLLPERYMCAATATGSKFSFVEKYVPTI